jgi:cation transport protein ChaC
LVVNFFVITLILMMMMVSPTQPMSTKSNGSNVSSSKQTLPNKSISSSNNEVDQTVGGTSAAAAAAVWCPEQQIYIGGVVPTNTNSEDIDKLLLEENDGYLRIFGYGSLCWHPGTDAVLSKFEDGVTRTLGQAIGWKRCWAQKSADHRGNPSFPGIVCTLLSDNEYNTILMDASIHNNKQPPKSDNDNPNDPSLTEGMIYTIPPALVQDCLSELDFREKGGYARDIIDVIENGTNKKVKALLYRGTPDNPAFWRRALLDLPFAAAVMSVAVGPSGRNDEYLFNLDTFLSDNTMEKDNTADAATTTAISNTGDQDTKDLAFMTREICQKNNRALFLYGSGSNQHNQLLLKDSKLAANLKNDDEAHDLKEMLLLVPTTTGDKKNTSNHHQPKKLYAGGGHSALLTQNGKLYLWGWNEKEQVGYDTTTITITATTTIDTIVEEVLQKQYYSSNMVKPLADGKIRVQHASLGHTHTLVIESETGHLYAFGENNRGQVTGCCKTNNDGNLISHVSMPTIPVIAKDLKFVDASAGLFHSAAITDRGELITFGCGRFSQCIIITEEKTKCSSEKLSSSSPVVLDNNNNNNNNNNNKWKPPDGSRLVKVVCGRRHTMMLDEHGRIWTLGENKYGQLGRSQDESKSSIPELVDGILGTKHSGCFDIDCGWSHNVAFLRQKNTETTTNDNDSSSSIKVYGWGRNDKGQLGISSSSSIPTPNVSSSHNNIGSPQLLLLCHDTINNNDGKKVGIKLFCCGSEYSMALDENNQIWGCGWNEHGNLALVDEQKNNMVDNAMKFTKISSTTKIVAPHGQKNTGEILMAAGGAHFIAMMI